MTDGFQSHTSRAEDAHTAITQGQVCQKTYSPVLLTELVTLSFGSVITGKVFEFALNLFPQCDSQFWGEPLNCGWSDGTLALSLAWYVSTWINMGVSS